MHHWFLKSESVKTVWRDKFLLFVNLTICTKTELKKCLFTLVLYLKLKYKKFDYIQITVIYIF